MVTNRLASNGPEWMHIYKRHNSGTYNNQWMVLNYNLFSPGVGFKAGFLWVGEQMPGYFVHEDQSEYLKAHQYWISFNRPFYPFIFNISNQWPLVEQYGDHFLWDKTARSVIFKEFAPGVHDEKDYRALITENNYKTAPIGTQGCSNGARSASNAISERGDLTAKSAICISDVRQGNEGGIDAKYTSYSKMTPKHGWLGTTIQSGPTHVSSVPPFVWSKSPFANISHVGQPDVFAFPWINVAFSY